MRLSSESEVSACCGKWIPRSGLLGFRYWIALCCSRESLVRSCCVPRWATLMLGIAFFKAHLSLSLYELLVRGASIPQTVTGWTEVGRFSAESLLCRFGSLGLSFITVLQSYSLLDWSVSESFFKDKFSRRSLLGIILDHFFFYGWPFIKDYFFVAVFMQCTVDLLPLLIRLHFLFRSWLVLVRCCPRWLRALSCHGMWHICIRCRIVILRQKSF